MSKPLASNLCSYKSLLSKGPKPSKKEEPGDSKSKPQEDKKVRKRSRSPSPSKQDKKVRKGSRSPSPSKQGNKKNSRTPKKEKINYDVPDRHFGDFFCQACECHMNSEDMWYHHISGKRHAKNTKMAYPVFGKKYDDIKGEQPEAKNFIDDEPSPLVGLSDVRESQKPDRTTYYCFICGASIETAPLLIEHLISIKHRMNYLKEYDKERYTIINESKLNKEQMEAIVLECVTKIEEEKGRGKMKIQRKIPGDDSYPKSDRAKNSWKQPPSSFPPLSGANAIPRLPSKNEDDRYDNPYPEYDKGYYRRSPEPMLPPREENFRDNKYESRNDYDDKNYPTSSRNSLKSTLGANSNDGDLRQLLEQKRSIESNVTDEALSIISALPTVSFFQLVLFKLDSIEIENEMEKKYLDKVVNKTTSMAVKINSQKFAPSLIEKFQESVKKNSLEVSSPPTNSASMQDLLRLVENYKDQRNIEKSAESRTRNAPYNSLSSSSLSNELRETSRYTPSSVGYPELSSMNQPSSSRAPPIGPSTFRSTNSTSLPYSTAPSSPDFNSGFSSFSSKTVSIPGLTLTQGPDESISPFQDLEAKARSIFGADQWTSRSEPTPQPYGYRNDPRY